MISDAEILGVTAGGEDSRNLRVLRRHFLRLARVTHPDKSSGGTAAFQQLVAAYERLVAAALEKETKRDPLTCDIALADLAEIDSTLFLLDCRCGAENPVALDRWWHLHRFLTVECEGCSAVYRVNLERRAS